MNVSTQFLDYKVKTVAFVDGANDGPEIMLPYWYAEMDGFQTIQVPRPLRSIPEIVSFIRDHAQAAICANRLDSVDSSLFSGAELAAALYDARIPTLLVTSYLDIDQHTSIRRWRSKLPVVPHLHDFEAFTIKERLEFCAAELQGSIAPARRPYQVIIGIMDVERRAGECYIDVTVGHWDRHQRVRLPASLLPEHLHAHLAPGSWFFAHVNVGTAWSEELYFCEFAPAPKPEYDEDLVYCIDVLSGTLMHGDLYPSLKDLEDQDRPFEVYASRPAKGIQN